MARSATPHGFDAGNSTRFLNQFLLVLIVSLSSSSLVCPHIIVYLSLLLRQQRVVDVAASIRADCSAAAPEWSCATFEIGNSHAGTRFFVSEATHRRGAW